MTHENSTMIASAPASGTPLRKPWQAPQIEDVSISMTAKGADYVESDLGETKNGS